MKLYEGENYKLYHGSMLDMPEVIENGTIDSIVTDPPYELNFMNKGWDNSGIAFSSETWKRCFDALKPGGYLLAFGSSRTYHRIACAIEDAGFEIRDTIMWLYGSGFPKSMNIGKAVESKILTGSANTQEFKNLQGTKAVANNLGFTRSQFEQGARPNDYGADGHERTVDVDYQTEEGAKWNGWGTALKPSYEPIIVARKPCDGSCVDNVLKYGVGGMNIDECRVGNETIKGGTAPSFRDVGKKSKENIGIDKLSFGQVSNAERIEYADHQGRFPANTILTYDDTDFYDVCGGMPDCHKAGNKKDMSRNDYNASSYKIISNKNPDFYGDSGSAARYFYCAKASKRDRDEGINGRNRHCTVKPTTLMQYLVRLVTPMGGCVLDPFNGSGSTGKAVMYENIDRDADYKYIGFEITEEYIPIAMARIEYAQHGTRIEDFKPKNDEQLTIFDFIGNGGE